MKIVRIAARSRTRVNPHTLGWWKWRLHAVRADACDQGTGEAGFVEVTGQVATSMTSEAGVLELEVGRVVLRIRGHVEADMLGRVLDVLEGHEGSRRAAIAATFARFH